MKTEISAIVVVDSSFIAELLIGSDHPDPPVNTVWRNWEDTATRITSLELLGFEITNVLYKYERRGVLSSLQVDERLTNFLGLPVTMYDNRTVAVRSLEIARFYRTGRTYDPSFVALAEYLNCELWTVDQSLYRTVSHHFPFVKVPGDA